MAESTGAYLVLAASSSVIGMLGLLFGKVLCFVDAYLVFIYFDFMMLQQVALVRLYFAIPWFCIVALAAVSFFSVVFVFQKYKFFFIYFKCLFIFNFFSEMGLAKRCTRCLFYPSFTRGC